MSGWGSGWWSPCSCAWASAVAVLALAREVGMLRLRLGPAAALEIPEEGPELGERVEAIERFDASRGRVACARRLHLGGLSRLPRARARDRRAGRPPGGRDPDVRRGRRPGRVVRASDPGQPVRDRPRSGRHRARQGDLQQPRPARERARHRRAAPAGPRRGGWLMAERDRIGEALESLAGDTSRRGFLARVGSGLLAATVGGVVAKAVKPGDAEAFHFCGHTFTTGSCIHPLGLPRVDARGFPIRPSDGRPVDNIGRLVNAKGLPISRRRRPEARPGRAAAPAGAANQGLRPDREDLRIRGSSSGRLVPVLRRDGPQALGLLRAITTGGSTATPRCMATATTAARSSASPTTRPTSHAERKGQDTERDGESTMSVLELSLAVAAAPDRPHRGLVALRVLDGGDDRARRGRWQALDHDRRLRHLRSWALCSAGWSRSGPCRRSARRCTAPAADSPMLVAAAIAVAAAAAEARGMRIVPQIRRQLPQGWRWTMPLPLASALYGVLLGLGFTTFVLSFGVWALAGISVALGDPSAGVRDRRGVRDRPGDPGRGGRPGRGHARSGSGASS